MATNLHILCGISGIGKSTWASKQKGLVVSRDKIRFSFLTPNEDYFHFEPQVFNQFVKEIQTAIDQEVKEVFADATHLNWRSRRKLFARLRIPEKVTIIFDVFDCDVETALERNAKRTGRTRVPDNVIEIMAKAFRAPNGSEIGELASDFNLENKFIMVFHYRR